MNQRPNPHHPPPIIPPKRRRGRQQETVNVKMWVRALNLKKLGFFFRVKNTGIYDVKIGRFRKDRNQDFVAIPDICGHLNSGTAVYIEGKYTDKVENKKSLIFAVQITAKQKEFLLDAYRKGCRAGVAFTLEDAIGIAKNDPLRHPRTFVFLPEAELNAYVEGYKERKRAQAKINQDPLARDILQNIQPVEDWEKL